MYWAARDAAVVRLQLFANDNFKWSKFITVSNVWFDEAKKGPSPFLSQPLFCEIFIDRTFPLTRRLFQNTEWKELARRSAYRVFQRGCVFRPWLSISAQFPWIAQEPTRRQTSWPLSSTAAKSQIKNSSAGVVSCVMCGQWRAGDKTRKEKQKFMRRARDLYECQA